MNLHEICNFMTTPSPKKTSFGGFDVISFEELSAQASNVQYCQIVKKALEMNTDCELPLYLHQYEALYAIAKGKDLLLCSPCGSGNTQVLDNAPLVAKMGFEIRKSLGESELKVNIQFKSLSLLIRSFLETAIIPNFNQSQYHTSLFKWFVEGKRDIDKPSISLLL